MTRTLFRAEPAGREWPIFLAGGLYLLAAAAYVIVGIVL